MYKILGEKLLNFSSYLWSKGSKPIIMKYLLLLLPFFAFSQSYYYPPINSNEWAKTAPEELGWCGSSIDSLLQFVEAAHSKSFIMLKDGKIVVEAYFDDFQQDSLWYWASAGKSLMGTLIGLAQQDGLLSIEEPTSRYLGKGWTSAPLEKEELITLRHQLSMTTGLDDRGSKALDNCLEPECLEYLTDPGTRWAYYNAPYRLLQDVLEKATGMDKSVHTRLRLGNRIGMKGLWFKYVYYSTARDMARFGHLILSQGVWAGDTIIQDQNYLNAMLNSSQDLNPSYGYLWWLNGKSAFMVPQLQTVFNRPMVPEAPADMVAALGKNDQKIYVVPSQGLVVVRQGEDASNLSAAALSSFDNELWKRIGQLSCSTTTVQERPEAKFSVYPNPSQGGRLVKGIHPRRTSPIIQSEWSIDLGKAWHNVYKPGIGITSYRSGAVFFAR